MNIVKGFLAFMVCTASLDGAAQQTGDTACPRIAIGADVSFLSQAETQGTVFRDQGAAGPGLQILRRHGYGWVRLRLFNAPTTLPNDLAYTLAEAKQAKALGFGLLLDFHYSDDWADPGHQITPLAWQKLNHPQLTDAVFAYTRDSIAKFREAGVLPDMVQVGNEVTAGILWPDGKLPDNWDNFTDLISAGIRGVAEGSRPERTPKIMIHIDKGGDIEATRWFFSHLAAAHVNFDVIGQSLAAGQLHDEEGAVPGDAGGTARLSAIADTCSGSDTGGVGPGDFLVGARGARTARSARLVR